MVSFSFPSPIAFNLGPWPIYWYGILYVLGLLLSWQYAIYVIKKNRFPPLVPLDMELFFQPLLLGVVLGGRLGDIVFYHPWILWKTPWEIFYTREGGMSFHGGLIGCLITCWIYCKIKKLPLDTFLNVLCSCAPIGLFFGRLGNFINQELYGYPSTGPFAVVFPQVDSLPRHPTPLYEAFGEGILLFVFMAFLTWKGNHGKKTITAFFLITYGLVRFFVEFYRLNNHNLLGGMTMGQIYSLPMIFSGIVFLLWTFKKKPLNV